MNEPREDNPTERLFEYGAHMGNAGKYRAAALAFSTAALGTSGAAPTLQADSYFLSAYYLIEHATKNPDSLEYEDDLLRARAIIQKALMHVKGLHDKFTRSMRLLTLLERLSSLKGDSNDADKACMQAMKEMRQAASEGAAIWDWWVYFRTRQLKYARSPGDAANLAESAANISVRRGDHASAAAFYLCLAQIHVTEPGYAYPGPASTAIEKATKLLTNIPEHELPASAPLRIARILLAGSSLLRVGHTTQVREELATAASNALLVLDRPVRTYQNSPNSVSWVWLPVPVMSALLQHLLACSFRTVDDGATAWVCAERALTAVGIRSGSYGERSAMLMHSITPRAERALHVALLESAARVRLSNIDLKQARPLVAAAVQLSKLMEDQSFDRTHASALLLASEYYSLTGQKVNAVTATRYLDRIENSQCARDVDGKVTDCVTSGLGDILALARTHRALLTGSARKAPTPHDVVVGSQVRAAAKFADGVYHMRNSQLVDAKNCIAKVNELVGEGVAANQQLICNALTIHAGLFLLYQDVPDKAIQPASDAVEIATHANDLVNKVRALRQRYKLLSKAHPNKAVVERCLATTRQAVSELHTKQSGFKPLDDG